MPAVVYTAPEHLSEPDFGEFMLAGRFDSDAYFKAIEDHTAALAEWVREDRGTDDGVIGSVIRFQIADGYAQYMVFGMSNPVELIHLNYGDGYQIGSIMLKGLDRNDVIALVEREKALRSLFGKPS